MEPRESEFVTEPGDVEVETAGRDPWWFRLPDGKRTTFPVGYFPGKKHPAMWFAIARRMIGDTVTTKTPTGKWSFIDPRRMSENQRWLTGCDRWLGSVVRAVDSSFDDSIRPVHNKFLSRMHGCHPPGYLPGRGCRVRTCDRPTACLFCYVRGAAGCYDDLLRCYNNRPSPEHPVNLFVRSVGFRIPEYAYHPTKGYKDPKEILIDNGAAGGVVCRVPVKKMSGGVLIGLTDRPVRDGIRLTERNARSEMGDAVVRHMAFPASWCTPRNVVKMLINYFDRQRSSGKSGRAFEAYGLCRKTGTGGTRPKLKYHITRPSS